LYIIQNWLLVIRISTYNILAVLEWTTHTSLSPIRRGFAHGFVNYKKGHTRLAAASDKVYQLLAHGRWFSPGTPASSTTKTGRNNIAEILLKVALNTKNQIKSNLRMSTTLCWQLYILLFYMLQLSFFAQITGSQKKKRFHENYQM
jgi:hypothetical protein